MFACLNYLRKNHKIHKSFSHLQQFKSSRDQQLGRWQKPTKHEVFILQIHEKFPVLQYTALGNVYQFLGKW